MILNATTARAKARHQNAMLREQLVLEKRFARDVAPVIRAAYTSAAAQVAAGRTNVDAAVSAHTSKLKSAYSANLRRAAIVGSNRVWRAVSVDDDATKNVEYHFIPQLHGVEVKTVRDDFWHEMNAWLNKHAAQNVKKVDASTKRAIRAVVAWGVKNGETNATVAKELRAAGLRLAPWRAVTIARTETHTTATRAMSRAMKATRIQHEGEWVSTRDERTRRRKAKQKYDHVIANGERVNKTKEQKYKKTGQALEFPGDPNGAPGNIINCRCVEMFHVVRKKKRKR